MSRPTGPWRLRAAVLLTAAGLAACAAPGGGVPVESGSAAPAAKGGAASAPAAEPILAATLVGLSAADITSRLGLPSLRRLDAPAEMWQYRGRTCVLDLFLYESEGVVRVRHAAVRARNGSGTCRPDSFVIGI